MIYVALISFLVIFAITKVKGSSDDRWKKNGWITTKQLIPLWIGMVVGILFLGLIYISEIIGATEVTEFVRPAWGEGSRQEEVIMEWKKENGEKEKKEITLEILEEAVTEKQIKKMFEKGKKEIDKKILEQVLSWDHVEHSFVLPDTVVEQQINLTWDTDHPDIVDWMGHLGENIRSEGEKVRLTAYMEFQEQEAIYTRELVVFPEKSTMEETVEKYMHKKGSPGETALSLPEEIQGRPVIWKKNTKRIKNGLKIFLLLSPVCFLMLFKQKEEEKEKKERQELLKDYPEFVTKLTLLLSTGVTLRKAFERISKDYMVCKKDGETRKLYEILWELNGEMNRGVSEKEVYRNLGERCELLCYRTLSSLLVQHLQKGGKEIEQVLEEEVENAQMQRQQQAKVLGQQASTKLLFPMILMLLIVFIILIAPVWLMMF